MTEAILINSRDTWQKKTKMENDFRGKKSFLCSYLREKSKATKRWAEMERKEMGRRRERREETEKMCGGEKEREETRESE